MVKFCKYLSRKGYRVHVVTVLYDLKMPNTYAADLESVDIVVHRIPSGCPHNFFNRNFPDTAVGRLQSAGQSVIRFLLIRLFFWIDYAQRWGKHLLPFCIDLVRREKIMWVLATGAPFTVNYWGARLRRACPDIRFINDYRDLWNDDPSRQYKFPWRRRTAEAMEQYALDHSDCVTATTDQQVEILQQRCNNTDVKFTLIPNGYDPEEQVLLPKRQGPSSTFSLIYTGNIGNGRDVGYMQLLDAIDRAIQKRPALAGDLRLELYGQIPRKYVFCRPHLIEKGVVAYHGLVSSREALCAVRNGFLTLLINADHVPFAGSSKVYEYFSMARPIFAITPPGWIDTLVHRYRLGTSVRTEDTEGQAQALLDWHDKWLENPDYALDLPRELWERFAYPNLVEALVGCWESLEIESS